MPYFEVAIDEQKGSSYEIGYNQGENIPASLVEKFESIVNQNIDVRAAENIFQQFAPHLLDEIKGLTDSLNIPYKKALSLFSGYDIPMLKGMGCSAVVTPNYYVRNYDFSPDSYDNRLAIINPQEAYASVGYSLHMVGRHEGVNEKGLAIGFHFVNDTHSRKGLSAGGVLRIVLDTCQTTDDAIQSIKELPHAWSYNYSIGDASGKTAVVEASPVEVKVRHDQNVLLCTNHFQHAGMGAYNRTAGNTSERLYHLDQAKTNHRTGKEMFGWFRDPNSPMFFDDYDNFFGTLHTFAYLFDEQKVLTAIANGRVLEIDMKNWNGERRDLCEVMEGYLS
ncbi:C45 family autoproteolytic acyltransferase/hydrolase [Virgibacillus natechei]